MIAAPNSSNHQAEYRCWQEERNKRERAGLQDGIETCYDAWFGDGGTDKKTGGGAGRGIAEDVMIFTESEHLRIGGRAQVEQFWDKVSD